MTFEDQHKRQLWGYDLQCTDSQQREILARLRASKEYSRWAVLDFQVREGFFLATKPEGQKLCEDLTAAEVVCQQLALRIITDVLRQS